MIKLSNEAKELYRGEIAPLLKQNKVKECTDLLLTMNTKTSREVLAGLCEMGYAFVDYRIVPEYIFNEEEDKYLGRESSITKAVIPESVEEIREWAFHNCRDLTSIQLPNSLQVVRRGAFGGCESLTHIEIPEGVKLLEEWTFAHCKSLTSIQLPNSLRIIDWNVFTGCTSLKSIEIPEGVREIRNFAFKDCKNLMSIQLPKSLRVIGESAFEDYCPENTVFYIPKNFSWEDVLQNLDEIDPDEIEWYEKHSKVR